MAVEVYYWAGVPGHVALRVDRGTPAGVMYLSRWPGSLMTALVMGYEGRGNRYEDDVAAEGNTLPHTVRLTKLNETAIKRAIVLANRAMVYNDFEANCSSHVRACLDAGLDGAGAVGAAVTHGGALGFLSGDTPPGVYFYALGLRALYA
jgi:hypothetical protein